MKYFRKYTLLVLSVIFIYGYDNKMTKAEQINIVTSDNRLEDEDKKILNEIDEITNLIFGKKTKLNDPDLRNTYEKISVNFDINMDQFNEKFLLDAQNVIHTKLNGKLLKDNKKGAFIYCLGNNKTFEIHKPLVISKQIYDMNDLNENVRVFKITQLKNRWDVSITVYKTRYDECS